MSTPPKLEHRFNDDLLISDHDQRLAKQEYLEIYHVLDHPELRDEFLRYDKVATNSRLWVQRIGLLSLFLCLLALLGSALTPLVRQFSGVPELVFTILFCAEIGGIIGVVISAGGMWLAGHKKKWLEARMIAEVLRIWHFQSLICRGKEIETSCNLNNDEVHQASYRENRCLQFQKFLREWSGTPDSHLTELIDNPESGYQMLHDDPTPYTPDSEILQKIFSAYKSMRFRHQTNYAAHKLQKQTNRPFSILKWPPAVLQQRMQGFTAFCLLASLICSLVIVIGHITDAEFSHHLGWPAAVIVFLVLTVAGRTIQDGLAAPEEFQRYNDYSGKIRYLAGRFELSHNPTEKLELMVEMERAALEELILLS